MKKISALVMLLISITIFIHAQEKGEKKVTISLISAQIVDAKGKTSHHLIMYDSNGNCAIDSLITLFEKNKTDPGKIFWEAKDGIGEIISIKPKAQPTIIFGDSVKLEESVDPLLKGKKLHLKLPENRPLPGEEFKEAYEIIYKRINSDVQDTIDPYIDLKPPRQ